MKRYNIYILKQGNKNILRHKILFGIMEVQSQETRSKKINKKGPEN